MPPPHSATIDFSNHLNIAVTVPPRSIRQIPMHWHAIEIRGAGITCVEGHLHDFAAYTICGGVGSYEQLLSAGTTVYFRPEQCIYWDRFSPCQGQDSTFVVSWKLNETCFRNVCGATLDKDHVPELASTPIWLKGVIALIRPFPSARQRLIDRLLWMQRQMIYHAHDIRVYYGPVPICWLWHLLPASDPPPNWAQRFEWKTSYLVS